MKNIKQTMRKMISEYNTEKLIDLWEETNNRKDNAIDIVRGIIMDELESRNAEAFNNWMDNIYDANHPEKDEPRYHYER